MCHYGTDPEPASRVKNPGRRDSKTKTTVQQEEQAEVLSFTVIRPAANRSSFWDQSKVEPTLAELCALHCATIGALRGWKTRLCAVNLPSNVSLTDVDAVLEPVEKLEQIADACPSNRHVDAC